MPSARKLAKKSCCPLYNCAAEKGFRSCGDCAELPCRLFIELKDPDTSDAEHRQELDRRAARLKEPR